MTSPDGVALLALCYDEMEGYSSVGPRTDGTELFDDFEAGNPNVSLLTMFASGALRERDWEIVKAMDGGVHQLSELLPILEPWRGEAVLHAIARKRQFAKVALTVDRAIAAAKRWVEVEEAMERWRELGISATVDDVHEKYIEAMLRLCPERSRDEIHDDLLDATWDSRMTEIPA